MAPRGTGSSGLADFGLQEVVVVALAAQRLSRAISTDQITAPVRQRLDDWAAGTTGRSVNGIATKLAELVRCPVCTGWWVSLATSALWPGRGRIRRGISVAGVQVLLALAERLVSEEGREAIHDADREERRSADPAAVGTSAAAD